MALTSTLTCPVCDKQAEVINGRFAFHRDGCAGSFAEPSKAHTTSEGRYTAPTNECVHPERWHAVDWDSAETEVTGLVAAFVRALQPDLVVETGAAWGQTAHAIGEVLSRSQGVLHTIEPAPDRADHTRQRCEGLPVVVEQIPSLDFVPPGPIGFAWLDSLVHLRAPEFRHFYPHFAPGAIVGFHDVAPRFGLYDKILELEAEGLLLPIRLPTPRGVAFAEVITKEGT
jgi:hypothetical protein